MDVKELKKLADTLDNKGKQELIFFLQSRTNGVSTKYFQHYLAWFRYIDSKEYENTSSNKKNMLVKSCLFTVTDTNAKLRLSAYSC
jgi:hypothetical protein